MAAQASSSGAWQEGHKDLMAQELGGGADQTHRALWLPRPPGLRLVERASDQTPEKFLVHPALGDGKLSLPTTGATECWMPPCSQTNQLHMRAGGRLSGGSGIQAKLGRRVFIDMICLPVFSIVTVTQHRA